MNKQLVTNFQNTLEIYEKKNLVELLEDSPISPAKFKQIMISELKKSSSLQQAFLKNPSSLFASILHCAELGLNPSQLVGEFFFIPFKNVINPILGYKGLITLLHRSDKLKKIWCEVVYKEDDFEYELGLEPKLVHVPNSDAIRSSKNITYIYAVVKFDNGDTQFKVMSLKEVTSIIDNMKNKNNLYFDDKKDSQHWMLKKIVLKQLAKLLPKEDLRIQKAISVDDNTEAGNYIILDNDDSVNIAKTPKSSLYDNLNKSLDFQKNLI
jgi:recombination protein RecT